MANKRKSRKAPGKNDTSTEARTEDQAMEDAEQDAKLQVEHDQRDPIELFEKVAADGETPAGLRCACGAFTVDAEPTEYLAEHTPHMLAELRKVTPPAFDVDNFIKELEKTTDETGAEIKAEGRRRILTRGVKRYKAPVVLTDHDLAKRGVRLAHMNVRLANAKNEKRDENSRRTGQIKSIEKEIAEDGAVIVSGKEIQDVPVLEVLDPTQHLVRIYSMVDGVEVSSRGATDADMQMTLPLPPKPEPTTPPATEPPATTPEA